MNFEKGVSPKSPSFHKSDHVFADDSPQKVPAAGPDSRDWLISAALKPSVSSNDSAWSSQVHTTP